MDSVPTSGALVNPTRASPIGKRMLLLLFLEMELLTNSRNQWFPLEYKTQAYGKWFVQGSAAVVACLLSLYQVLAPRTYNLVVCLLFVAYRDWYALSLLQNSLSCFPPLLLLRAHKKCWFHSLFRGRPSIQQVFGFIQVGYERRRLKKLINVLLSSQRVK